MILDKLNEFAERIADFPPLHFTKKKSLDWLIEIDEEGKFIDFVDVSEEGSIYYFAENLVGRSGRAVRPLLLGDKAKYIFGNTSGQKLSEWEESLRASFYELTVDCYQTTKEIEVKAVTSFLEKYRFQDLTTDKEINDNDWLAFRIDGKDPLQIESIKTFWQDKQNEVAKERSDMVSECLICGKEKAIADRHPEKLKLSSIGGHGRGNPLISANLDAFESYGLKESRIAPICFDCATLYGRAANYLIDRKDHSLKAGNILYIFWTKTNQEFNGFNLLSDPKITEVKTFINSYKSGSYANIQDDKFYVLALSANNSRTVVRDWIETTLLEIKKNIANFFNAMELEDGREERFYGIANLASSTALNYGDIKPVVVESLASYALKGTHLSEAVLYNTIKRIKADVKYRVTRPRVILLKMFFNSNPGGGIKVGEKLDKENKNDAYLCGRLFSVIELIQKMALPGIKSTIVDRYYGTASAAPASVFGNLMRKAQHHLAKLRKDESKQGLYYWLQQELEAILVELDSFPSTLSLKEQGVFALGYYQQKAYRPENKGE